MKNYNRKKEDYYREIILKIDQTLLEMERMEKLGITRPIRTTAKSGTNNSLKKIQLEGMIMQLNLQKAKLELESMSSKMDEIKNTLKQLKNI